MLHQTYQVLSLLYVLSTSPLTPQYVHDLYLTWTWNHTKHSRGEAHIFHLLHVVSSTPLNYVDHKGSIV